MNETPKETKTNRSTKSKPNLIAVPMKNDIGEQNCFVNVIIHTMHYIPEMLDFLLKESNDLKANDHRLLIELSQLLTQYNEITAQALSRDIPLEERLCDVLNLRKELASLFKGEELFKLGLTGDPIDLLFIFFNAFHSYSVKANSLKYCVDRECKPSCPSHELFSLSLVQQYECESCKAASDLMKYDYNYFIYEIQMRDIMLKVESMSKLEKFLTQLFALAKESTAKTPTGCPSKCKKPKVKNRTILISSNPYLCFSLSWKELNPKLTDICKMFFMIPIKVSNSAIFDVYNKDISKGYDLFGMICYWGGHYVCFFKSLEKEDGQLYWIFHDDRTVNKVNSWKDIIIQCVKSHYHPVMLFYRDSGSRASAFEDSTFNLNENDYKLILAHCEKVENETQIQGGLEGEAARIRPGLDLKRSDDVELKQAIASLQKIEEMKRKKSQKIQEDEDTASIQLDEEPSLNQSTWKCTYNNCNNYNNYSTFQCIKCLTINLQVFKLVQSHKDGKGLMLINTESKATKFEVLNKSIAMKSSQVLSSSSHSVNPLLKSSNSGLINPSPSLKKKRRNPQDWECPYCLSINESDAYCLLCKRNRPFAEQLIIKERKINSVKHYL